MTNIQIQPWNTYADFNPQDLSNYWEIKKIKCMCIKDFSNAHFKHKNLPHDEFLNGEICEVKESMVDNEYFMEYNEWLSRHRDQQIDSILND